MMDPEERPAFMPERTAAGVLTVSSGVASRVTSDAEGSYMSGTNGYAGYCVFGCFWRLTGNPKLFCAARLVLK